MESVSALREQYEDPRDLLSVFTHPLSWPMRMMHGLDPVTFAGYDARAGFVAVMKEGKLTTVSPFQLTVDGVPLLELARTRSQLLTAIQ